MELRVQIPNRYAQERKYVISVLLGDFLGVNYSILESPNNKTIISIDGTKQILVSDVFFSTPESNWLSSSSLPKRPLKTFDIRSTGLEPNVISPVLPIIFGDDPENLDFFLVDENTIYIGIDIFGSAFFMLSRYEETVIPNRDHHNRFPASASLAYQEGFLLRPIVNEYVEVLWSCLFQLWPELKRKERQYRVLPSHDVDYPFTYAARSKFGIVKSLAGDILKRRSLSLGINNFVRRIWFDNDEIQSDPNNTFNWIMDISEDFNLTSVFNFIPIWGRGGINGDYSIRHPLIRSLLRKIHARGHEIGAHFSYNSYRDAGQTCSELETLKAICKEEGVEQKIWGGRQHFLRWENSTTIGNWENAGLNYDSTLTYADHAGYRCGVCYEFPIYDLKKHRASNVWERPLIIMECSVTDENYMGLGTGEAAYDFMKKLKTQCKRFSGDFSILWHNDRLNYPQDRQLYKSFIDPSEV